MSWEEDGRAIAGLRRQVEEIASECERRGLRLLEVVRERERLHTRPLERPGLGYALGQLAAGRASGLVVSELSRVSHSVPELGRVLDWLSHRDARFVAILPGLDTDEAAGRLVVRTIIEVSRWERERLVERTRVGMRAARRKGPARVADFPDLSERIAGMRAAGMTLQAIANQLNAEGIPTVRGGATWRPSSVQAAAGYERPVASHRLDLRPGEASWPSHGWRSIADASLRTTSTRTQTGLPAPLTHGVESVNHCDVASEECGELVFFAPERHRRLAPL